MYKSLPKFLASLGTLFTNHDFLGSEILNFLYSLRKKNKKNFESNFCQKKRKEAKEKILI